jgi:hypothetical protein
MKTCVQSKFLSLLHQLHLFYLKHMAYNSLMTITNHVLAGVAIGVSVQQPLPAFLLALASHFVLDALPHFGGVGWYDRWGKPLLIMAIADVALSFIVIALSVFLFPNLGLTLLGCAVCATLPDWPWILHYKFGWQHKFFDFHQAIQRFERPWGAYVEVGFAVLVAGTLASLTLQA